MPLTSLKRTAKLGALVSAFVGTALGFSVPVAHAQTANGGWFVPKSAQPEAAPRPVARHVAEQPVQMPEEEAPAAPDAQRAPPILPLPPVPTPPVLPKGKTPPPVVVGVINVQAVMQMSTAQQEIQQVLGARRDHLAQEVQHEEASWREEAQKLQAQARSLTADQIQLRERHLQERRAKDQREFGNQARILQEAAQVAYHQIERELEQPNGIIASVAGSHSMNLVLHSEQVVLHVGEHDITDEVITQLNKTLPHVFIPADGVDPEQVAKSGKMPTTADENGAAPAPEPTQAPAENAPPQSVLRQQH